MEHEPVVSPQELASLDEKAFQEEVSSRLEMGVLKEAKENELPEAFVELTTTSVHNWRYRGNAWKRKSRLVAREYKWSAGSSSSGTSSSSRSSGRPGPAISAGCVASSPQSLVLLLLPELLAFPCGLSLLLDLVLVKHLSPSRTYCSPFASVPTLLSL